MFDNNPIAWIAITNDNKRAVTGRWKSTLTQKLYISEATAESAMKNSRYKDSYKIVPVYANPEDMLKPVTDLTGDQILNISMDENDAKAKTIGEYLIRLIDVIWAVGEGFSGKRPFGNSGWEYELYGPLAKAGAFEAKFDTYEEDGNVYTDLLDYDEEAARECINRAIKTLYDRVK